MHFRTTMASTGANTGIEVPADVIEALGGGRRPAVRVVANGYAFRSTVGVMAGRHLVPFSADRRRESGLGAGDELEVDVELDDGPRDAVVPDDLADALRDAGLAERFAALAPSRRKAHVASVEGARAAATRSRRIEKVVAELGG